MYLFFPLHQDCRENQIDDLELYNLLADWKLTHLFKHFQDQYISIEVLKILSEYQVKKLFRNLTVGEQAVFESKLRIWKDEGNSSLKVALQPITYNEDIPINTTSKPHSVLLILNDTQTGKQILKFYEEKHILYEQQRVLLINTLAKYLDLKGYNCTIADCSNIEFQICSIFPTEKLDYYTTGKRGKLYNKIHNIKRMSKVFYDGQNKDSSDENADQESELDWENSLKMLRSCNITAEEFDLYWSKCTFYRLNQIKEMKLTSDILKQWPEYARSSGYLLVSLDFQLKFPKSKDLMVKWADYGPKMLTIIQTKVTSASGSAILQNLQKSNEESKIFYAFWFLHHIFPPALAVFAEPDGSKLRKKFTISDSQQAFAIIGKTAEELEAKLHLLKVQSKAIQPLLLVIADADDIKSISIYFDGIRYPVLKTLQSIDILYKLMFLFNLEFPKPAETFYLFIQNFFYDMPSDKKSIKVSMFISQLLN